MPFGGFWYKMSVLTPKIRVGRTRSNGIADKVPTSVKLDDKRVAGGVQNEQDAAVV